MIEARVDNGPYVFVDVTSNKGVAHVRIENKEPNVVGITKAELTINCGSTVDAADLLAYLMRDLDFSLVLKQTYGG